MKYNFDSWLNSQIDFDVTEIIANGFDVISDAELVVNGYRQKEEDFSMEEYVKFSIRAKTFMTLLKHRVKDVRVSESDWKLFKVFCEELVAKKKVDKAILDQF